MSTETQSAVEQAVSQIPTCALDEEGVQAQRARYMRLGRDVRRIRREPDAVVVEFSEGLDRNTLEDALAVERACCPFFLFEFDVDALRLRTTVRDREQLPALDAIQYALS